MMWDERYSAETFAYGTEPNDFLAEHAGRLPRGRMLCLAEGEGRNAVFLAQQGHDVVAVDASSMGMQKAQRLAREKRVAIGTVVADLADYDIAPGSYDGVVSIFCHLPPGLRADVHRRVVEGLKPGGVFLLEAYTPDQLKHGTGGPPVKELMMSLTQLRAELKGLKMEVAREIERPVHEGQYHDGIGAVVQVIATKS